MPSHERHVEETHYSLHQEVSELYWVIALRSFAIQLPGFFVPIFVYLLFDQSMVATLIFYVVQFVGQVIFVPVAAKAFSRFGLKKLMAFGGPWIGVYLIMLALAQDYGMTFVVLAIVAKVIYLVMYWPARHTDFARFASRKHRGTQLGKAQIIATTLKALAPLLGGWIIVTFGFTSLFVLSGVLLLGATIPLFFSPEVYEHFSLNWRQSFTVMFKKKNRRSSLAFFIEGIEYSISVFLLPIFIYLVIGKFDVIGYVSSASLIIAIVATYYIGRATDRRGGVSVISLGSIAHAFGWIILSFIKTPFQYFIYASFYRIAETANHLPFTSVFYKKARERGHGIDEFIVFHEIAHNLGRVAILGFGVVMFANGSMPFMFFFIAAGVSALLYRIIK